MSAEMGEKWIFLVTAWSAFFFAAISPGPNMLAVMQRAFSSGRKAAVGVAAGIACGSFLWAISTSGGMEVIADRVPILVPLVGLFGGAYLIYLGFVRVYTASTSTEPSLDVSALSTTFGKDVIHGFVVIVSNPKVALFWLSLSSIIAKSGLGYFHIVLFAMTCALTALTIYVSEALVFSSARIRSVYFRSQAAVNVVFSLLFAAIGIYLICSGSMYFFSFE